MASQDRAWTPQEALYPADELEEVLGQKRCAELKQECTEEILLLHLFNEFEWETSPRKKRIDIVDLSSTDVKHLTRFTISEIKRIRRLLGIPDRFSTPARVPFHGDEALFLLLCRLAHPIKVRSLELHLYGDAAYPLSHSIISPYDGANPSQEEKAFNSAMGSFREVVE
jgi:hypothetical protein